MADMKSGSIRNDVSDAARRCADIVNGYILSRNWDELRDSWVAIRLSDGGSDGTLYDTKRDAVRHQLFEMQCAYVSFRNLAGGISPLEAERYLDYNRRAYDAGFRLPDPDAVNGGPDLFLPSQTYDALRESHVRRHLQQIAFQFQQ
jgi:hypothetical protein